MNINVTLFGQMISFAVFVWFCMKYVWPPLMNAMQEREKRIADGLSAADQADKKLDDALASVDEQLAAAKGKAAEIIELANKRATQIVEEAKNEGKEQGERIKANAENELDAMVNQAREALRNEVANLAISGAEKILKKSVDSDAHTKMLNELVAEL